MYIFNHIDNRAVKRILLGFSLTTFESKGFKKKERSAPRSMYARLSDSVTAVSCG